MTSVTCWQDSDADEGQLFWLTVSMSQHQPPWGLYVRCLHWNRMCKFNSSLASYCFSLQPWKDTDTASLNLWGSWKVHFVPEILYHFVLLWGIYERVCEGLICLAQWCQPGCDYWAAYMSEEGTTLLGVKSLCCLQKSWGFRKLLVYFYCNQARWASQLLVSRLRDKDQRCEQ